MREHSDVSPKENVPMLQPISEAIPILQPVLPQGSGHGTPSLHSRLPEVENRLAIAAILVLAFPFGLYYLARQSTMGLFEKTLWAVAWLAAWVTLTLLIGASVMGFGVISMILCLVACFILIWTHPDPKWTSKRKGVLSGMSVFAAVAIYMGFMGIVVFPIILYQFRQAAAEAERQWAEGHRQDAVTFYKHTLTHRFSLIEKTDQPTFFQRVIEFDAENGNTTSAITFIDLAEKKGVSLTSNEPKAQELLAQVRREREQAITAERAKKEAAEREKREVADRAEKERQERIAAAKRLEREVAEKERQDRIAAAEQAKKEAVTKNDNEQPKKNDEEQPKQEQKDEAITPKVTDFIDNTNDYKGKTLKMVLTYVGRIDLRDAVGSNAVFDLGNKFIWIDCDPGKKGSKIKEIKNLPNLSAGDKATLIFICGEGELKRGNRIIDIKRKD